MKLILKHNALMLLMWSVSFVWSIKVGVCIDDGYITRLKTEIVNNERLWQEKQVVNYYQKSEDIIRYIASRGVDKELNQVAATLLENLITKEVVIQDVGVKDLHVIQKTAQYLLSSNNALGDERQNNARLLSELLGKVRMEKRPDFKLVPVFDNVPVPQGVQGMAGMDPAAIKDPVARAKYEAAIKMNHENSLVNVRQLELQNMEQQLCSRIIKYLVETFKSGGLSPKTFDKYMDTARLTDQEKDEIRRKVSKGVVR